MLRLAFEEAAGHFQMALATLDRLPADPDVRYLVLTSLGRALNASTGGEAADSLWLEAAAIAAASNDPQRIFDALVGYDLVVRLQDQGTVIRFLDDVLRLVGPEDSPLRARALAWRHERTMRGMGTSPDPSALDEAVAMARRTGDRDALASVLQARMVVRGQSPDAEGMLRDAQELASEGLLTHERWMLTSRDFARALLRLGRRTEADAHAATNRADAERSGLRMAINGALMLQSSIAVASGDFATGKLLAAEAAGRPASQLDILALAHGAQLIAILYERGRTDAVVASLRPLDRDMVALTPWHSMLASVLAEVGELDDAATELQRLVPRLERGFSHLYASPVAIRYVAEACSRLGDRSLADRLIRHIEPWSGTLLVVNTTIEGAADRSLGHLLAIVGRLDDAIDAYAAAGELERRAEFPPLYARTGYWHARALVERDDPGDRERAAALVSETTEISGRFGMRLLHQQAVELADAATLGRRDPSWE
jgi:tetratricopeptide (TPR) repeat protein